MKKEVPETVYRIKVRQPGGDWRYVVNDKGIPISITTDHAQGAVIYKFKHQHPSIANQYIPGETLIAEPDLEATKRLAEFKAQQKKDEDDRIQGMWWNN